MPVVLFGTFCCSLQSIFTWSEPRKTDPPQGLLKATSDVGFIPLLRFNCDYLIFPKFRCSFFSRHMKSFIWNVDFSFGSLCISRELSFAKWESNFCASWKWAEAEYTVNLKYGFFYLLCSTLVV